MGCCAGAMASAVSAAEVSGPDRVARATMLTSRLTDNAARMPIVQRCRPPVGAEASVETDDCSEPPVASSSGLGPWSAGEAAGGVPSPSGTVRASVDGGAGQLIAPDGLGRPSGAASDAGCVVAVVSGASAAALGWLERRGAVHAPLVEAASGRPMACHNASAISRALPKRASGAREHARKNQSSTAPGSAGLKSLGLGGGV